MSVKDELQALGDAYVAAYRVGDTAGCAAAFTADAILYSSFAPVAVGRTAIAALHAGWTVEGQGKTLTVTDSAGSGDFAWARADFAERGATTEGHALGLRARPRRPLADQGLQPDRRVNPRSGGASPHLPRPLRRVEPPA